MRAAISLAALLLATSSAFAQNGSPANQKNSPDYSELAKAPEKARTKANPLERDPDAIPAGANLFDQHCSGCHGEQAQGGKKGPSLRAPQVQTAPPGAIFWLISNGVVRKGMPVWAKLPEPQRWQLVAFIKSLGVTPSTAEKSASANGADATASSPSRPH